MVNYPTSIDPELEEVYLLVYPPPIDAEPIGWVEWLLDLPADAASYGAGWIADAIPNVSAQDVARFLVNNPAGTATLATLTAAVPALGYAIGATPPGLPGLALDVVENAEEIADTIKWIAAAAVALGLAYLVS